MAMNAQFLFPLSFCFALVILTSGCGSQDVAKKEAAPDKQPAKVEKQEAAPVSTSEEKEPEVVDDKVEKKETTPAATAKAESSASAKAESNGVELTDKEASVADGAVKFTLPANWESVKPRSFVVEHEIKVPKSEGDEADGRLTIMGAGGSIEANLERWYGQYSQPDGSESKDAAKTSESTVADCKVTWFDLSGTMLDKPGGPFAGGEMIKRENYRTLAAIVQAGDEVGQYFVKVYGPSKTISDNEAAFRAFVESLAVNPNAKGL